MTGELNDQQARTVTDSPAATRNLLPILDVLLPVLPSKGRVLEIASGTGQHIAALAAHRADLAFHPTEPDPTRRAAIDARCADLANVSEAKSLDASKPGWGEAMQVDVVLLVNLLHLISDAQMAVLLDEVARAIRHGGIFALYGPFFQEGRPASEGDLAFDRSIREKDSALGYKQLGVVETVLGVLGFQVVRHEMPANNIMLICTKSGGVIL